MDDEELPIISSSPLLATAPKKVKTEDEMDMPTLKRVQAVLEAQINSYATVDRLTVEEKDLTVKEQLAVNKSIVANLREVKAMVDIVIKEVREKYE